MPRKKEEIVEKSNGWEALNRFNAGGYTPVAKPDKEPLMPRQLSTITSDVLGDLMSSYSAWREYTEDKVLRQLSEVTRLRTSYDFNYSKELIVADGGTDKQRKANVDTLNHIHTEFVEYLEANTLFEMLSSKLESYTNSLTIISREISRRESKH